MGDNNIYLTALNEYINQLNEFYTTDFYSPNKNKILYIQQEKFLEKIPNKINEYKIIKITPENKAKYFRNGKAKLLTIIFELKQKDGKCFINITPYKVEYQNKNYTQTVSDWTLIYFRSQKGNLIHSKTENGGI